MQIMSSDGLSWMDELDHTLSDSYTHINRTGGGCFFLG